MVGYQAPLEMAPDILYMAMV